jgi:opacity protein-like surface antigen
MVDAADAGCRLDILGETAMNRVMRSVLPVAALGLVLMPGDAPAQTFDAGPYVGVSGGAVLIPDNEGSIAGLGTAIEFDPGWDVALQLGYRFSFIRAEIEAEYGQAAIDRVRVGGASIDPGEDFRYVRGTGGLYLDFTLLPLFTPYVGGGVGAAYILGDDAEVGGVEVEVESDTYLTAHGEVGLALDFLPVISIVPAYRYMWFDTAQGEIDDTTAHLFKVGARLEF